MYLKATCRLRRDRSNQRPFKGRSLIKFLQEQRAERDLIRSCRVLLLGLWVLISFACEPSAEIPPLEINSDVGQLSSTPTDAQGRLKSRAREPNLKITVRSMLLAERVKLSRWQLPLRADAIDDRLSCSLRVRGVCKDRCPAKAVGAGKSHRQSWSSRCSRGDPHRGGMAS